LGLAVFVTDVIFEARLKDFKRQIELGKYERHGLFPNL